jgi:hypothetical protein
LPQRQEKAKPAVNTEPSSSWLDRIFGSSTSTPEIQQGIDIAKREMPGMAPVKMYGPLSRLMRPDAQAYTSPGRTIYMNPAALAGQTPQDIADTLTHEQEHVRQMSERGYGPTREFLNTVFGEGGPYGGRTDEMLAFQAEKDRRARMRRPQTAVPRFNSNEFYIPQDINLPSQGINTAPSRMR